MIRARSNIGKAMQVCSFIVLIGFMMRGHPPAHADQESPRSLQEYQIAQNKQSVEDLRIQVSKQNDSINAAINSISGIQGEERGLAGILILLQIGQFVFRVKNGVAK